MTLSARLYAIFALMAILEPVSLKKSPYLEALTGRYSLLLLRLQEQLLLKQIQNTAATIRKPAKATISSCTSHIEGTQKLQRTAKVQY